MQKNDFIQIEKVELLDGEELMSLPRKIMDAMGRHKAKLNRSLFLRGIFNKFIIAKDFETGRMFQMDMSRDQDGDILLGNPVEVKQTFVPVKQAAAKAEDGSDVKADDRPTYIKLEKESLWKGIV